jgi:hypothetical protein
MDIYNDDEEDEEKEKIELDNVILILWNYIV